MRREGPSYSQQKQAEWPWPMAVLSRQKQTDGQTSRFQRQIAFSLLSRTISLSPAGPSYSQQKQAQWPFYQREAQCPLYQGRSKRMARPPDFSDKLHFRYYPARSVYHRPGQAILAKAGPMAVLSTRPNDRFTKAERMARPPDFSNKLHFRYYPARSVYQRPGQAILSKSRPNGRFINARLNGRFLRQFINSRPATDLIEAAVNRSQRPLYQSQWPFYQGWQFSSKVAGGPIRYCAAQAIYQRTAVRSQANCCFIKASFNNSQWPLYQSQCFIKAGHFLAKLQRKNCWASELPFLVPYQSPIGNRRIFLIQTQRRPFAAPKARFYESEWQLYDGRKSALVQPGQVPKLSCASKSNGRFFKDRPRANGYLIHADWRFIKVNGHLMNDGRLI